LRNSPRLTHISAQSGGGKKRSKKAANKKKAKALLAKAKGELAVEEDKKLGLNAKGEQSQSSKNVLNGVTKGPEPPKPPKKKELVYVPLPIMSLVDATQGSAVLKTQVDCTKFLDRGDVVRIHKPHGYVDWSISSDPKKRFDSTTITLAEKYVHMQKIQQSPEEIERLEKEKLMKEKKEAQAAALNKMSGGGKKNDDENGSSSSMSSAVGNLTMAAGKGRRRGGPTLQGGMSALGADIPMSLAIGATSTLAINEEEEDENIVVDQGQVLEVSERSGGGLMKTRIRASEQQAKRAASEAS